MCVAYDGLERFFPKEKNCQNRKLVRASLLSIHVKEKIQEANKLFQLKMKTTTVLVLGGSLGARKINQLIEANISFLKNRKYKYFGNVENFIMMIIKTCSKGEFLCSCIY